MSKTITLNLKKSLILESVKADTYQSGLVDKSANPVANASLAASEQAGGEAFHERKLLRFIRSGLAKFAASMSEFVDPQSGSIHYTISDDSDEIEVTIIVSDRYNDGLVDPLSSIAEEFVTYIADYMWWQPLKPEQAKNYLSYAKESLGYVSLCLAKTAPEASSSSYTDVNGTVQRN